MDKRFIILEHVTNLNSIINQTFQATQRIKLISFDVSQHYIIFGASSGGLYIFERKPHQFKKLIPSKGGTADLISISPNEKNVAIVNSKGSVIVLENCFTEDTCRYQIYTEHEGQTVTALKWHEADLYCGDSSGKVSVILALNLLTKAIFQTPIAAILHLELPVVQIDCFQKYLLVSTKSRTYLCDTDNEHFKPIGKKLRDGLFGACFLKNCKKINGEASNDVPAIQTKQLRTSSVDSSCKIYCSRPGGRLWEANFEGAVIYTHQFRNNTITKQQSEVILIQENADARLSVIDHSSSSIPMNFNFEKLHVLLDRFLLTFNRTCLYIIDPVTGSLMFWSNFYNNIQDIKVVNSTLFIWQNKEMFTLTINTIEEIILETLFCKQFYICAELCLKFKDDVLALIEKSSKIHLIGALREKIHELGETDLLEKISPLLEGVQSISQQKVAKNSSNGIKIVENVFYYDDESSIDDINISDGILNFRSIGLVSDKINEGTRNFKEKLQVLETKVKQFTLDSTSKNFNLETDIIETVPKKINTLSKTISQRNIDFEPKIPDPIENIDCDDVDYKLTILLEQYKLNKLHKNVETTRVTRMLQKENLKTFKELLSNVTNQIKDTLQEDPTMWCQVQFLKYAFKTEYYKDVGASDNDLIDYLQECFCDINFMKHSSCPCGYPLPNAHNQKPMYYEIGLALTNMISDIMKIRSNVPFMWANYLNSLPEDDISMSMPLMLQYNEMEIIKKFSRYFFYDSWDDAIKHFLKLKRGCCLNCDSHIDNKGLISWNDFGLLMLRSIGGLNTMKLLQLNAAHIPKGELNEEFYQACIFTTSLNGLENVFGTEPLDLCLRISDKTETKTELRKSLGTFLRKKYMKDTFEPKSMLPSIKCGFCDMPVNIEVLEHTVLRCSHYFHNLCLLYTENICILCNKTM